MTFRTLLPRLLLTGAVALGAGTAGATTAGAAVRHAAANGDGTACTAAAPCLLQQALDGAAARGDEIVVHAGRHSAYTGGGYGRQLAVHGADGEALPTIDLTGGDGACALSGGPGSTFRRLRLKLLQPVGAYGLCLRDGSVAEQLVVSVAPSDAVGIRAADSDGVAIRDTSVHAGSGGGRAIVLRGSDAHVDNVSARGTSAGLTIEGTGSAAVVFVRNSFLDGARAIEMSCAIGAFATVSVAHSALGAISNGTCGVTQTGNVGLAGTNVTLAGDDVLRPAAGSTLREAGEGDAAHTGTRDVDGQPRRLGARLDIGADEVPVASEAGQTSVHDVDADSARFSTLLFGNGAEELTAEYQLGETTAYGLAVPAVVTTGGSRLVLTIAVATPAGLAPATEHHVRLKLRNEFGLVTYGEDVVFTTAAVVDGGGGAPGGGGTGAGGGAGSGEGGGGVTGGGVEPGGGAGAGGAGAGTGTGAGSGVAANAAPACKVRVVRARRGGRVVLRGRCSERATLRLVVARKGRRAVTRSVAVPGGRSFAKAIGLGRLATLRRPLTLTARDAAGVAARPLALRIVRR